MKSRVTMSEVEESFKPRPKGMRAYTKLKMEVCCHELKMYVSKFPDSYARDCVYSQISDYEYHMLRLCRRWAFRWPWVSSSALSYYAARCVRFGSSGSYDAPGRVLDHMGALIDSQPLRFDSVAALDALIAICGNLRLLAKGTDS